MEKNEEVIESPSTMTYVIGAIVVVAVIAGAWYFRSKGTKTTIIQPTGEPAAVATPPAGPITGLNCDQQYYNPKIGFSEYYLSAAGGDLKGAREVTCTFTASVDGEVIATATAVGPLSAAPQRGGGTFTCTTNAMKLEPNVPTVVDVVLKDDLKATSTCSATFNFPRP